jgi:hypothetical protein
MALATYSDLQTSIAGWLNRSDLTAVIPDFVTLAEGKIARDLRIRKQVVNTTLTTVAGTQTVSLPSDFLELENISLTSTSPPGALSVVTPEIMDRKYPAGYGTGQPVVYALVADTIQFGPTPDAAYTVSLDYYQRFAALSVTPTNWLLTNYPSIYLFGALAEAASYLMDEPRAAMWTQRYGQECAALQSMDDQAVRSGSAMRVRAL